MNIFTSRLAVFCIAVLLNGVLHDTARADSIVHFTYASNYDLGVPGEYYVQVYSDSAPLTAKNFLRYVTNGAYDNSIVHYDAYTEIVKGGRFKLDTGSNQEALPTPEPLNEIQPYDSIAGESGLSNIRGTIAMENINGTPNDYTSQWCINLGDNSASRKDYTVFGRVLDPGMTFVDGIDSFYPIDLRQHYDGNTALDSVPAYPTQDGRYLFITISKATVETAPWDGGAASVDWSQKANWGGVYKDTCVPDGAGSKISLDNQTTAVKTLDMASAGRTVGSIVFTGSGTSITSSGQFSLTLDNIDKPADISVTGTHSITAPVILASDTTIQGTGELTLSGGISGGYALKVLSGTLNATSIQVDSLTIGDPSAIILPASWKGGAGTDPKDWGLIENWNSANSVPGGAGCKVVFGEQTPNNPEVDLKTADQTAGIISFNSQTSTTIMSSGQHILTLDNLDKTAEITVSGTHTISVPVVLGGDAVISGPGTLDMTGGITGAHKLTVASGILNATSIQVDTLNIGNASAAAVPEPSTAALLSLAFAGFFAYGWRNKKRANY
jgi:cyclophilin family peptidyl-prolyl cis-trans isomerase